MEGARHGVRGPTNAVPAAVASKCKRISLGDGEVQAYEPALQVQLRMGPCQATNLQLTKREEGADDAQVDGSQRAAVAEGRVGVHRIRPGGIQVENRALGRRPNPAQDGTNGLPGLLLQELSPGIPRPDVVALCSAEIVRILSITSSFEHGRGAGNHIHSKWRDHDAKEPGTDKRIPCVEVGPRTPSTACRMLVTEISLLRSFSRRSGCSSCKRQLSTPFFE